jgi:cytochrome c553
MGRKISMLLGIALILNAAWLRADEDDQVAMQAAIRVAVGTCAICHGPGGNAVSSQFPRLAAQPAEYLAVQLKAFRSQSRKDPDAIAYMWGMAARLDDATIDALARYYQAQKPQAQRPEPGRSADPVSLANGKRIYVEGIASRNISACASCHGRNAEGAGQAPRLAGQHTAYTMKQLNSYQSGLRNVPIMRGITKDMQVDEMQAVAAYLQSIG